MLFRSLVVAGLLSVAQAAKVQTITVGWDTKTNKSGLVFSPNNVAADVGDTLKFVFQNGKHNVMQSDFDHPCKLLPGGASSDTFDVADGATGDFPTWTYTLNNTWPTWFYCGVGTHCQKGMSMVVNEHLCGPTNRSLDVYQVASAKVPSTGATGSSAGSNNSTTGGNNLGSGSAQPSGANNAGGSAPTGGVMNGASGLDVSGSLIASGAVLFALAQLL